MKEKDMAEYNLTKPEKETIILWNETDEPVRIDTFDAKLIKQLNKRSAEHPEFFKVSPPDKFGGVSAEVPKSLITVSVRAPISEERHRQLSEQARAVKPFLHRKINANNNGF